MHIQFGNKEYKNVDLMSINPRGPGVSCPGLQICSWPARRQSDPMNASPPQLHIVYGNIVCISSSYTTQWQYLTESQALTVPSLYNVAVHKGKIEASARMQRISEFKPFFILPHSL